MQVYFWALFIVVPFCKFGLVSPDDTCEVTEKPRLQIVLVIACGLNRRSDSNWGKHQSLTAKHLMDYVVQEFPDTEFALTGFIDYPDNAKPTQRDITNEEHCYILMQDFTTDKSKIVSLIEKQIGKSINHKGNEEDSVTTAMLFTAVEKKLNWNNGFYDLNKKLVRKIMIPFVFRNISATLKNPGQRGIPKADGTDSCKTALPPSLIQLEKVLFDHQFVVINAVLNAKAHDLDNLAENHYSAAFGGFFVPYYQIPFPAPGVQATHNGTYDYKEYAKRIYDTLKKEVMECDWEDPLGYNTLGL